MSDWPAHQMPSRSRGENTCCSCVARRRGRRAGMGSWLSSLVVSSTLMLSTAFMHAQPAGLRAGTGLATHRALPESSGPRQRYGRQSIVMMPSNQPMVPYKAPGTDYHRFVDIYQRLYYDRVLLCGQFIDDRVANQIMSILWYLHQEDKTKPIYMYFNVPGALLRPALAVYDTMKALPNEIESVNIGLTTGMGAFLCAAGTKGRRFALPNARFLMQKTGFDEQVYGQASDIVLEVKDTASGNRSFLKELSGLTGRTIEQVQQDFKRDFYLSAEESVEYGVVDRVIYPGMKDGIQIPQSEVGFGKFASGGDQRYQTYIPADYSHL